MSKTIRIGSFETAIGRPFFLIAGPCVIESESHALMMARKIKKITDDLGIPYVFKASYDKANRSSLTSYRGPGIAEGLRILRKIKDETGLPILSDVHRFEEIEPAAEVLDIIQIPAFLCRQTDLVLDIARTGKIVNVKKGQFLAPEDMGNIVNKIRSTGNDNIILTERGSTFGYHNLVVDMRGFSTMQRTGFPVVFDATHSVQRPGGLGCSSGGDRDMVPALLRAAIACGIEGVFLEVHDDPEKALCDGPNSIRLADLPSLLAVARSIDEIVKGGGDGCGCC